MEREKRKYTFKGISENSLQALLQAKEKRESDVQAKWEAIKAENKLICKVCSAEKTLDYFSRTNLHRKLPYMSWCTECKKCEQERKKKERRKGAQTKGLEYNITSLFKHIQRRAKLYSMELTIDVPFLVELFENQKGICPYTGLPMSFEIHNYQRLSLDRINSDLGYTKENIVWCCWIANNMKQDMNPHEFKSWIADLQKTLNL